MRDLSQKRRAHGHKIAPASKHKFALGAYVMMVGRANESVFKITRLLPDGGTGFQYRIKNEKEGYERVTVEQSLAAVPR